MFPTNRWGSASIVASVYPLIKITNAIPAIEPIATAHTSRHTGCVFSQGDAKLTA